MNNAMIDMLADVLDSTPDPLPFWEQAQLDQDRKDREDQEWEDYQSQFAADWDTYRDECMETVARMAEEVMYAPEPPVRLMGKLIAVEWEDVSRGSRWWVTMDEGELDREIWFMKAHGVALSDIDSPRW